MCATNTQYLPVISNIKHLQHLCEATNIMRSHTLQKVDILLRMESAHIVGASSIGPVDLKA